jgi:hypothetical protein
MSQARRLGGLHRTAPVPVRGSSFTAGLHPPAATPQGLIACLYKRWSYGVRKTSFLINLSLIPSLRFRDALGPYDKCVNDDLRQFLSLSPRYSLPPLSF